MKGPYFPNIYRDSKINTTATSLSLNDYETWERIDIEKWSSLDEKLNQLYFINQEYGNHLPKEIIQSISSNIVAFNVIYDGANYPIVDFEYAAVGQEVITSSGRELIGETLYSHVIRNRKRVPWAGHAAEMYVMCAAAVSERHPSHHFGTLFQIDRRRYFSLAVKVIPLASNDTIDLLIGAAIMQESEIN